MKKILVAIIIGVLFSAHAAVAASPHKERETAKKQNLKILNLIQKESEKLQKERSAFERQKEEFERWSEEQFRLIESARKELQAVGRSPFNASAANVLGAEFPPKNIKKILAVNYSEPTSATFASAEGIQIICEYCSPVLPQNLSEIAAAFSQQMKDLETNLGVPIPSSRKPIQVRLMNDRICSQHHQEIFAQGYTSIGPDGKAFICLRGNENSYLHAPHTFFHELTHQYFLPADGPTIDFTHEVVDNIAKYGENPKHNFCANKRLKENGTGQKFCNLGFNLNKASKFITLFEKAEPVTMEKLKPVLQEVFQADISELF